MAQNELQPSDNQENGSSPFSLKSPAFLRSTTHVYEVTRRQFKLLYYFLISLLLPLIASLVILNTYAPSPEKQSYLYLATFCIALVLFALLVLRFGHYTPAARTMILLFTTAPWVVVLVKPSMLTRDIVPLLFITLSISLSTLFLTLVETILTVGVQFLLLVILTLSTDLASELNAASLLLYVFLLSTINIMISYIRDENLKLLQAQDRRLEKSRKRLHQQSMLDPVTGLYNRAHLENLLSGEMARAEHNQTTLGVLLIDIDHFKKINDTYGHSIGDIVLREIGQVLSNNIRQTDYLIRHGGDELVVIMPGASTGVAQRRAEQFRANIERLKIPVEGQIIDSVSLSIGVATFPEHGKTEDTLIGAADQALHQAKAAGRNQVMLASKISQ